jgi:uncharacterized SAM-binding protein YcdF (DUF218 family)
MKHLVANFFYPLPFCCHLLVIGVALLWWPRTHRAGKVLVTLGTVLLLLLSTGHVANLLLAPLETAYPPVDDAASLTAAAGGPLRWIGVLHAGQTADAPLPLTARVSFTTLSRLAEGIRLHRLLPGSKLAVSVEPPESAGDMTELLRVLGVAPEQLQIVVGARDTAEEAALMQRLVGAEPFALITSASHLPRAMAIFQARGMRPVPVPAAYLVRPYAEYRYWSPSLRGLERSDRAVYEYLAATARTLSP